MPSSVAIGGSGTHDDPTRYTIPSPQHFGLNSGNHS